MTKPKSGTRAIQKKICMLGSFAVGKTSLVARYVHSMFSAEYLTTVGVKIDKKELEVEGTRVRLMLWDLHGEDAFQRLQTTYLRGSSGYVLVADGTRRETLDVVRSLHERASAFLGDAVPFVLALNKVDLVADWEIEHADLEFWRERDTAIFRTSAKTGQSVEEMLAELTARMVTRR